MKKEKPNCNHQGEICVCENAKTSFHWKNDKHVM